MKFAIYSRKSVYTGKGESVENQIELCKAYIAANYPDTAPHELVVYEDEGFSGKNLERPQFQSMLRDIDRHKPDCVVCYRLDRISRNVGDFAALIEHFNAHGIAFVCIREKFDTTTPMGKAMMYIASVFAQLERETIAERVRDNMLMLAKLGRWLGGTTPTGYVSEKQQEVILDGKIKTSCRLRPEPREIQIVSAMFAQFLALQSVRGVQQHLAAEGITSRTGGDYSLLGIKEILQNPVYCTADLDALAYFREKKADVCFDEGDCGAGRGLLSYNKRDYTKGHAPRNSIEKWIIAVGRHAGLVSGKDWVRVQHLLARRACPAAHANNDYSLLSGLIICSRCGKRMFAKPRSGQRADNAFDYICQSKLQFGTRKCDCQNLHGQTADDLVAQRLRPYLHPDGALVPLLKQLQQALRTSPNAAADLRQRITACQSETEHLVDVLARGGVSDALLTRVNERMQVLEADLARLHEEERRAQAAQNATAAEDWRRRGTALASFDESFNLFSVQEKRDFIRLLVKKCEWDGETLHIYVYSED